MTKLRFRPGTIGDRKALRALYNRERSPVLPPPNNRDLETALRDGRFIIGETEEGEIVACAAMIPFSPADSVTYVGELTGAFVDKRFRGGKPLSLQTLMLGLRVLHHVVLEGEAVNPAATNTIVTVVAKTNEASLANVKKAGFVECESLPDWWEYETSSWHKGSDKDKWQCFRATSDTVQLLALNLVDHGLLSGKVHTNTSSGELEIELAGFRELELGGADIRKIASGQYRPCLSDLPDELRY